MKQEIQYDIAKRKFTKCHRYSIPDQNASNTQLLLKHGDVSVCDMHLESRYHFSQLNMVKYTQNISEIGLNTLKISVK